jgi:hypothetical protein
VNGPERNRFRQWLEFGLDACTAIEAEPGKLVFPDRLRVRAGRGEWKDIPIVFEMVRNHATKARKAARDYFKAEGLSEAEDRDLFAYIDTVALLALVIRDPEPPHGQHRSLHGLLDTYSRPVLMEAADRFRAWEQIVDPRVGDLDEESFAALVHAVKERGHLGPLAVIDGPAQNACVLRMAIMLSGFLTASSSSHSPETSNPESSTPPPASGSSREG